MLFKELNGKAFSLPRKEREEMGDDGFSMADFKLKFEYSIVVQINGNERRLACKDCGRWRWFLVEPIREGRATIVCEGRGLFW